MICVLITTIFNKMRRLFAFWIYFVTTVLCTAQQVSVPCINEIMQSNIDCFLLEHEYPDSWIELYNPSTSTIDIKGYTLKTNKGDSYKIPSSTKIAAKGYLIIPCDKVGSGIHTNFRLESTENGSIALYDASGKKIDELPYNAMIAPNIAYGRKEGSEGSNIWGWELKPTPNSKNQSEYSSILLPNPIFSVAGHVMNGPENLTIKMPQTELPKDTKIYATIDGSEPTTKAPFQGTELSFHISQNTNIRAKLISSSALSPRSLCHSYIFHPRNTDIPIFSITGDEKDFFSKEEGFLWFIAKGKDDTKNNFQKTWRRPMNAEFLGVVGQRAQLNQNGEIAISGQASRYYTGQPSLKLYANKRFGKKRYEGDFWTKDKPNVTKVKSFILRNGGNAQTAGRINDAAVQQIFGMHLSNLDYQAYSPAIVYINGQYKGVCGLRERSNEDYVEANYNGLEDIEITDQKVYTNSTVRNSTTFKKVYDLYNSKTSKYEDFEALIDIDNFMKTMIVEIYSTNSDWPHNNISMWRSKENGGKWRWILKDLDFFCTANRPTFDMFKFLLGTPTEEDTYEYEEIQKVLSWSANNKYAFLIYKKMIEFEPFREKFIDLFATYLGDFLKPDLTSALAKEMRAEIESELKETAATFAWNYEDSAEEWIPYLIRCFRERPDIIYCQMADFFDLGSVIKMSVIANNAHPKINDVGLTEGDFDGAYFSDRKLRLSAGRKNAKWHMTTFKKGAKVKDYSFDKSDISLTLRDYATCDSVSFSIVGGKTDFDLKLEELAISTSKCNDFSNISTIKIAEPHYAYANITGTSIVPTSKSDNIHAYIDLYDNAGNYMRKKILLNLQGNSSAEKKSLSIQFCEDDWIGDSTPDITFGNWVAQDEFHLKAFYEDGLRGTAEVAYHLYSQITERDRCYPDAFPISIYLDGSFYGVMAWQLKKHRANMALEKKNDSHVWLDGTLNDKQLFQKTIGWEKFEVRNPKDLYNADGSVYNGDYPQEIMGSESPAYDPTKDKMVRTANAKKRIIELSQYCSELKSLEEQGASYNNMRNEIRKRFDVDELINYKVFSLITNNYDGFSKNWQWFTRDGKQWTVAPYDCNLTFGYNEDGNSLWDAQQSSKKHNYEMQNSDAVGPMLWIKNYFWDEVKERYAELRKNGIINAANISGLVRDWYQRIGEENYEEEWARWPESPCITQFNDSPERFEEWITNRIALEDIYLGYSPTVEYYDLTITEAEWVTICLPFSYEIPDDVVAYTVKDIASDGCTLILEQTNIAEAYKPYLLYGPQGQYLLYGESVNTPNQTTDYLKNGLLCGTLEDSYAPKGSYVLQNKKVSGIGFYAVNSDNYIPIQAYRAYLLTNESSKLGHYRLQDNTTNILTIDTDSNNSTTTFNYWGQQIDAKANGFQIRRMPDGLFQKVIIK